MMKNDGRRSEVQSRVIETVGEVISAIKTASHVDHVICALHSLAVLFFPVDSSVISACIDERCRDQVVNASVPSEDERAESWKSFYAGAAFPTLSRALLFDVASNWLPCFPISAREYVYDVFFVNGLVTEVVQTLVPYLQYRGTDGFDANVVVSNIERLIVLCLIENNGVLRMARELGASDQAEDFVTRAVQPAIARVAQVIASVPDKARPRPSSLLSSHHFFKQITIQLLCGAQERNTNPPDKKPAFNNCNADGKLIFVGETFSRICRRGSSDVLLAEMVPRVLGHVRSLLSSSTDSVIIDVFESNPESLFWVRIMEMIKDHYAIERMSEQLLHQLENEHATDIEAYWTLWMLFKEVFKSQPSFRSIFVDKFLLWKVFSVHCLRWILQFAVFECPPVDNSLTKGNETRGLLETIQRLVAVWSKREFMQSTPTEQQIYVTAAVGLCLEKMSKEELDKSKDVMHSILQGVSCRLENPAHLVRKMASGIAYVFSKVIDPKNPLYLDDSFTGESIDWGFGFTKLDKGALSISNSKGKNINDTKTVIMSEPEKDFDSTRKDGTRNIVKKERKKLSQFKLIDPDEIIDPVALNYESTSDKDEDDSDDDASENSDASSDSSLVPYDLTDDARDLKKNFAHLVDIVGALRKSDDADGVERALDVTEKLVRASPDELTHIAGELFKALVQVRCSEVSIEGEEESAEEKRQRALVALLVTCPFQSLDSSNKLLYSPNVDISQRIMILDVMTEAAQELADSKTMKPKHQRKALISTVSESQPWFLPSSMGPAGAGLWKEVSETGTLLNYSNRYERELPSRPGQITKGKTRRWSLKPTNIQENHMEWHQNKFPLYAAAFMLPAMEGFDKKRHGVDLLGRDFIVLGKLIYMLGVCMRCMSMHPEASALAPPLLYMLRTREICHHKEAYVRRAVLFAASCMLVSLHPSFVASALSEGNLEVTNGLEWVRTFALDVAETDVDKECYMMAMTCLQLHAEMALQASRALESGQSASVAKNVLLPQDLSVGTIKIPYSNVNY